MTELGCIFSRKHYRLNEACLLNQTFSLIDIPRLLTLVVLEGVLSVDNALALALIARSLPKHKRKKALLIGLVSALIFRAGVILGAAYLIQFFWIQLVGGLYLVYLGSRHMVKPARKKSVAPSSGLLKAVVLIEVTDLIFALDSILAALALVGISSHFSGFFPPKIWIVYVGGLIGLIGMRFAAHFLTSFLEKFPKLEKSAHLIVIWIGVKLIAEASAKALFSRPFPLWADVLFWSGIVFFFVLGFCRRDQSKEKMGR